MTQVGPDLLIEAEVVHRRRATLKSQIQADYRRLRNVVVCTNNLAVTPDGDRIAGRRLEEVAATVLEDIFSQIRAARMVVMVSSDSEDAEGDLVMAAEKVTPQHVNFMASHARGVVSVALPEKRMRELGIPLVAVEPGR